MRNLRFKSFLFLVLLFSTGTLNIALRKPDAILERENRKPKPWPELTWKNLRDGAYTRKWEEAFADRFLLRAESLSFADWIRSMHGLPGSQVQIIAGDRGDIFAGPVGQAPGTEAPKLQGQWVKGILVIGNHAYTTAGYEDQAMQYYANGVNGIAQRLPRDYKVFCMIAPSAIEFLEDERYTKMSYSQTKGTDQMYAKLSPQVTAIRISAEIAKHKSDYNFHRTDHHWTARGAYHAYVASAPALGIEPVSWDTYKKETIPGFLGTLYNATGAAALASDPDTLEVVYPPTEHKMTVYTTAGGMFEGQAVDKKYIVGANKYMSYIAGDYPLSIITTQARTGKKILVLKDSNANAFIPFLIPHYDEVHVIDPRYWNGVLPAYIKQHQIKHVLFAHYFPIISVYNGIAYNIQRITGP
jgi:hypothetical protein